MLFTVTLLAIAITQPAGTLSGVSVSFVTRQTVDCDDTRASGISKPGAIRVNDEIGSTSIQVVSTGLANLTGMSRDEYASIISENCDLTNVDLLGGGVKS